MTTEPILIIAYNKPALLSESLAKLNSLTQGKIYVHIDGPQENARSKDLFLECKSIVDNASLKNPQIISKVRDMNLGGQFGVLEAIDWFFENETFGIILEEDIGFGDGIFQFVSRYKSEVTEPWNRARSRFCPKPLATLGVGNKCPELAGDCRRSTKPRDNCEKYIDWESCISFCC